MNPLKFELERLGACTSARIWAASYNSLDDAWNQCPRAEWMMWYVKRQSPQLHQIPVYKIVTDVLSTQKNQDFVPDILSGVLRNPVQFLVKYEYPKAIAIKCLEAWRSNLKLTCLTDLLQLIAESEYPGDRFRLFIPNPKVFNER